jgi:hypothetical protein
MARAYFMQRILLFTFILHQSFRIVPIDFSITRFLRQHFSYTNKWTHHFCIQQKNELQKKYTERYGWLVKELQLCGVTKGYGATTFTELHRTLYKDLLIWRQQTASCFISTWTFQKLGSAVINQ